MTSDTNQRPSHLRLATSGGSLVPVQQPDATQSAPPAIEGLDLDPSHIAYGEYVALLTLMRGGYAHEPDDSSPNLEN